MLNKITLLTPLFLLISFMGISFAQEVSIDDNGTEITVYEDIISFYDQFTDELTIRSKGFDASIALSNGDVLKAMSTFVGTKECDWDLCGEFKLIIVSEDASVLEVFNIDQLMLSNEYPILFDDDRDEISITAIQTDGNFNEEYTDEEFEEAFEDLSAGKLFFLLLVSSLFDENIDENLQSEIYEYGYSSALVADFTYDQLQKLTKSQITRLRVEGNIVSFGEKVKDHFLEIDKVLTQMRGNNKLVSKGETNELNQHTYELSWEGNIKRDPMVQPLPQNTSNSEGVISVRFQVKPDGTVGLIVPLKKMNPELEKEVTQTLRNWKFSKLPSGVPQQAQWGTITFQFVF